MGNLEVTCMSPWCGSGPVLGGGHHTLTVFPALTWWLAASLQPRPPPLSVLCISEGQPSFGARDLALLMVRYHPSHPPLGSLRAGGVFAEDYRIAFGSTFRKKTGEGHHWGCTLPAITGQA